MSDKNFFNVQCRSMETKLVKGSFKPNGSSALVDTDFVGAGYTVARTSAGVFTVTLDDTYPAIAGGVAELRMAGSHPYKCNLGTYTAASKTAVIQLVSVDSLHYSKAADGAANTTTAETALGVASAAWPVGHIVRLAPTGAVTASDADYATITLKKRTAGGSATTIAEITTETSGSGGTGNWVAFTPLLIATTEAVAAGDVITLTVAKTGSGVQLPAHAYQACGVMDVPVAATTRIDFELAFYNTLVTG